MKEVLNDPQVQEFKEQFNLAEKELIESLAELKYFVSNKDLYRLDYDGQIQLVVKKNKVNDGIEYLEEAFFGKHISLDDVDIETNPLKRNALHQFVQNSNKGLYLVGPNGIGKTFLVIAFANWYYDKNKVKTLYVFWPDFIEKTKRFDKDNVAYINKVKYAPRLIIDDLGQESITKWSRDDILNSIIAYRLSKGLTTTITSNYLQSELGDLYNFVKEDNKKCYAIMDKIKALSMETKMEGKNFRHGS